jgi:hypothetical protein
MRYLITILLFSTPACSYWHSVAQMTVINDRQPNGAAQDIVWLQHNNDRDLYRCASTIHGPYCVRVTWVEKTQFVEPPPATADHKGQAVRD